MLQPGDMLQNRYRVVALLGQGGMGAVYRAWDIRLTVEVALKEMTIQPGLDPDTLAQLREQFQQEATVLARLNHPSLVSVIDFFEEQGSVYLVMQFVEGQDLAGHIRKHGVLSEQEVLALAEELLDALAYCHDEGIIHRDIKPQNVIIQPNGRPVLVDFGLVKLWNPHDPRTRTAMRGMGTPEYAPPEQYEMATSHTDARSDIYSVGATLYHALTGQVPPTATMRIAVPSSFQPPRSLNPSISPRMEAAVMRATELALENRFGNAREMAAALRSAVPVAGATVRRRVAEATLPEREAAPPAPPSGRRRTVLLIGSGAAGTFLIAFCGLLLSGAVGARGFLSGIWRAPADTATVPVVSSNTPASIMSTASDTSAQPSTRTDTSTPTPTTTSSPTPTSTSTATSTPTPTPTDTSTPTPTDTPTPTPTPTPVSVACGNLGGRIVFSRKSAPTANRTGEIWVLDVASGSLVQLTRNDAVDWIPSWSPDGSQIAFTTNRKGNYDLWVMNADGNNQRPWITLDAWDEYASWSPDGAQLAFATTDEYQGTWNSEIFVGVNNTSRRRVTFNAARDEWPTWSPDGRWLACSSDRDGDMDIYIFSAADGGNIRNWTADTHANVQPNWSPDGQWIAFIRMLDISGESGPFGDVWVGRPDGSDFRQLTRDGRALHVAWSPDGRCLVFSRFKDSTGDGRVTTDDVSDLWVISVDGQQSTILTEGPELDFAADWTR